MADRGSRRGKTIDVVHWTLATGQAIALSAGTVASTLLAAQHLPETLLRMRGEWVASLDGVQNQGIGVAVAAGAILVPEGIGTTVLWSPITDGDAPWVWWDTMHLIYEEYVADT